MKKLRKIIFWLLIAFIGVIVIGIAGVMIFFPKDKIKEMAIDKISSALDREVTIEGISVSFVGGIGAYLEGIKISNAERFEKENFLEAAALDIKFQFWPLLSKEIIVDRLILVEPEIELHKLADGTVNYEFGVIDSAAPPEMAEKLSDESKLAISAISFKNLSIENGQCNYVDDSSMLKIIAKNLNLKSTLETPKESIYRTKGTIEIESLQVVSDTLSFPSMKALAEYDADYNALSDSMTLSALKVDLNGLVFTVTGTVPNMTLFERAKFTVQSESITFAELFSLLTEEQKAPLKDYNTSGNFTISATANYDINTPDTLQYAGTVDISNLSFSMKETPGSLTAENIGVDFKNNLITLDVPSGYFEGNPFKASIRARNFDKPYLDGKIEGTFNLAALNEFLPKAGEPKLSGDMTYGIKFDGPLEDMSRMRMTGEIQIKNGSYTAAALPEQIESFNVDMNIDSRNIILNRFEVDFESSDLALTGKLMDAFPYFIPGYNKEARKPFLEFELASNRLNIDKLFPAVVPGEGAIFTELPSDSVPPIILPDINGKGTGKIDTLIYSRVEFTNILSDIIIDDRKIKMKNVTGNVYTGKVSGESEIDLNDFEHPQYSGTFDAKQIEANDFITRFTTFGGHLFGKANLKGSFTADGLEPEEIINSLSMDGEAFFNEARLVNFDLVKKLADQFNFKTFEEETVKDFISSFKVEKGRVQFDGLRFFSNLGDWNIIGSVGFDGTLDYKGEVLLSEKYSNELLSQSGLVAGLASMFQDKKTKRINVPFKLSGLYSNPKIQLDFSFKDKLQENVQDNLKDKAEGLLKGLFKKKK